MKTAIKKTLKDTLTNAEGKVSRKSVTMFVSMSNLVALTWVEMVTNMPILKEQFSMHINSEVLYLFGAMAAGLAGISVWDKGRNKPPTDMPPMDDRFGPGA
jgi:hypothetical protein